MLPAQIFADKEGEKINATIIMTQNKGFALKSPMSVSLSRFYLGYIITRMVLAHEIVRRNSAKGITEKTQIIIDSAMNTCKYNEKAITTRATTNALLKASLLSAMINES